ncbi:hypothetical protein V8C26DRAFT_154924 [Trichoderma gracile]
MESSERVKGGRTEEGREEVVIRDKPKAEACCEREQRAGEFETLCPAPKEMVYVLQRRLSIRQRSVKHKSASPGNHAMLMLITYSVAFRRLQRSKFTSRVDAELGKVNAGLMVCSRWFLLDDA